MKRLVSQIYEENPHWNQDRFICLIWFCGYRGADKERRLERTWNSWRASPQRNWWECACKSRTNLINKLQTNNRGNNDATQTVVTINHGDTTKQLTKRGRQLRTCDGLPLRLDRRFSPHSKRLGQGANCCRCPSSTSLPWLHAWPSNGHSKKA